MHKLETALVSRPQTIQCMQSLNYNLDLFVQYVFTIKTSADGCLMPRVKRLGGGVDLRNKK